MVNRACHILIVCLPLLFGKGIALAADSGSSGGDDVGMSLTIGAEKKLHKGFTVGLNAEYRQTDNFSSFERFTLSPSVDYKITTWLKASAGFVFMYMPSDGKTRYRDDGTIKWIRASKNTPRYRAYVALTGSYTIARLKFSLRERYQYTRRPKYTTIRDYFTKYGDYNYTEPDERPATSHHLLRSRLAVEYDIRHCPLTPFVSAEIYNSLRRKFKTSKWRYMAGVDWKVTKRNVLSLTWTYDVVKGEDDISGRNTHLIGLGYTYKF
ncbi:MAG: DUF2490 domain-containing protein [Prevotella sp.]|nr:DUF2490 domain-containing protein [Prevotella sp.]